MSDEIIPWTIVGVFLLKEIASAVLANYFKRGEDYAALLQENTKEVIKLRAELNFIHQVVQEVPKMKQDIHEAHSKLREYKLKREEV